MTDDPFFFFLVDQVEKRKVKTQFHIKTNAVRMTEDRLTILLSISSWCLALGSLMSQEKCLQELGRGRVRGQAIAQL